MSKPFHIKKTGAYRTRDGRRADLAPDGGHSCMPYPGYVGEDRHSWDRLGRWTGTKREHHLDLVAPWISKPKPAKAAAGNWEVAVRCKSRAEASELGRLLISQCGPKAKAAPGLITVRRLPQ